MDKSVKIWISIICTVGIIALFLISVCDIMSLEGTIYHKEASAEIEFDLFEVGCPSSLETNRDDIVDYAEKHNGEGVRCTVFSVRDWDVKRFFVIKIEGV